MSQIYNIYCDESCHLENDRQKAMTLGAIWCPVEKVKEISKRVKEIKERHGLKKNFEIKWTKVSPAKTSFYLDIIDYFFDNDDLHFRCLVIGDKSKLNHNDFSQTHDEWYYKMYFDLLKIILEPTEKYNIYLDIKDTRSADKVKCLKKILCNNMYDFNREIIGNIQNIRSHESELAQIADLLIGAISYLNRSFSTSESKKILIKRIQERSGYSLQKSTLISELKLNILIWEGQQK
ncbi:MAG: DUF3800 domain-containing protein [bacterium]